jgi:hypothetical protein
VKNREAIVKLYGDIEKLAKHSEVKGETKDALQECLVDLAALLWAAPPPTLDDEVKEKEMKITFNTGRAYTVDGQVIIAEVSSGRIWFADISRQVFGSFRALPGHAYSEKDIKDDVMYHYDRNLCRYEGTPPRGEARPLNYKGEREPAEREYSGAKDPQRLSHIPDWRDLS